MRRLTPYRLVISPLLLELASASPPNPLQCLACLRACTPLQMRLRNCPPISSLTTPYASKPLPHPLLGLQSLCSCRALKLCIRRFPHHPYASLHPPLTILTPLMILTLLQRSQDETTMHPPIYTLTTPYNPYAPAAPSRYASNATLNPPYA
ncbi:hypothetical protein O181_078984 [Austropuccinia psidii MF-1]|uniref:Secreted protein n=1 Tax=Austropuccinia psidii MF-1 TaxID=1389203 RepID=A0A9Q3FI01_9BASI|nr:hypothetical protein [Austropuccinia psidii MF-1]